MEQNTNSVKQTENFGEIIGLLKSKKIKFGTSAESQKNYANGSIEVEITNDYGISVVKVDVMEMELNGKGEANKRYKALQTIDNEYQTIDANGREAADLIQVFVKIEENNYYNKEQDEVFEGAKVLASTNFDKGVFATIKRVADKNTQQKATISFGGMITNITPNEQTGELKVEMVGADYHGQAVKHKLDVSKELAANFSAVYQVGSVTTLHYMLMNTAELQEVKKEVAFGVAPTYSIEKFTRKNLVCGGEPVDFTGEMTQEKVQQMLKMREVKLEEVKQKALSAPQATTTNASAFGGVGNGNPFGGAGNTPNTTPPTNSPFGAGNTPTGNPFGA